MKFLTLVKSSEDVRGQSPPQALMEAIATLGEEAGRAGLLLEMGGLMPSASGARIALRRGRLTVTDGPFTEAKEVVGGYAFFAFRSREEAVEWTVRFMELHRRHWPEWDGETEIRQVAEFQSAMPGRA